MAIGFKIEFIARNTGRTAVVCRKAETRIKIDGSNLNFMKKSMFTICSVCMLRLAT